MVASVHVVVLLCGGRVRGRMRAILQQFSLGLQKNTAQLKRLITEKPGTSKPDWRLPNAITATKPFAKQDKNLRAEEETARSDVAVAFEPPRPMSE